MGSSRMAVRHRDPETNRLVTVVHFTHPDCGDNSLCGDDLAGD